MTSTLVSRLRPLMVLFSAALILGLLALQPALYAQNADTPDAPAATTIVIDRSDDPDADSITKTCNYSSGIYQATTDGCTLRRALVEAGARPLADRPIAIQFNLAPGDPGYDGATDTWLIEIDEPLRLKPFSITEIEGSVTIDGATQPGGRAIGPKVYIDTNDNSLEVELENNVIRNLGIFGGGVIFLKEDGNTVENVTMGLTRDGQSIVFRDPSDPKRMAGGGVHMSSNNNTVAGNVISGGFASAIIIDGGDNNLVELNSIGTRADGTVPAVDEAIKCLRSFSFDPANWYGGWGISVSGRGNQIIDNRIAGLHILQSANDTPPRALEIFGSNHRIEGNVIGIDSNGDIAGTCGQGIKVSGFDTQIVNNTIAGTRLDSEDAEAAAILASDTSPLFGQITVRGNLVTDGPGKVYSFGPGIPDALQLFNPAKITSVSDSAISGTNGETSPNNNGPVVDSACPNCIVDLYLDDTDNIQEALVYLGSATADGDGNWSFPLSQSLPADAGVRTASTTQSSGVIGNYGAGTSTKLSTLYIGPSRMRIEGPTTGEVDTEYTFNIMTEPFTEEEIYTYTVTVTDAEDPLTGQFGSQANLRFTWSTPGVKTVEVRVENALGAVTETHTITISGEGGSTPTPTPDPSTTPGPTPTATPEPGTTPGPGSTPTPGPGSSSSDGVYLPVVRR